MVDPSLLCRKHLLGEHVECHMFRGSLLKGKSLRGFLESGLLDSRLLVARHEELAAEMMRRGYRHASPLPLDFDSAAAPSDVDTTAALGELAARCEECRQRQSTLRADVNRRVRRTDRAR